MSAKKEIYIINQYYHPFFAATGQLLKELAEHLNHHGYHVRIITGKNGKRIKGKETIEGIEVKRLPNTKDGTVFASKLISYITFYFFLFWHLLISAKKNKVVLTLSTPPLIGIVPVILKKIKKFKIIYCIQDLYPEVAFRINSQNRYKKFYKMIKYYSKKIIKSSDEIILIGECMEDIFRTEYNHEAKNVHLIENWSLQELEEYPSGKERPRQKGLTVLYAGNLGRGHEYDTLIQTIHRLQKDKITDITFRFVGGGYNYQILKQKIPHCDFVEFLPYVDRKALPDLYDQADICVVISSKELSGIILPSKFYGIMAMGKPVIYINSGEDTVSKHIRKGDLGITIQNQDHESLYQFLLQVREKSELLTRLEKNVITYYDQYLRREKSLNQYLQVIEETERGLL